MYQIYQILNIKEIIIWMDGGMTGYFYFCIICALSLA